MPPFGPTTPRHRGRTGRSADTSGPPARSHQMGSRSRRTQSVRWARGRNDEYAWSESAGLAYSSCNSTLVGHLRGAVTQQCQDLDGGRGELGDEPVGEAGGHPARGRTGPVGFHSGGVGDGAWPAREIDVRATPSSKCHDPHANMVRCGRYSPGHAAEVGGAAGDPGRGA